MIGLTPESAAEWNAALAGRQIGAVMAIMDRLGKLDGYASSFLGEKVQGGTHTPPAVLRAELRDKLSLFPRGVVALARAFREATGARERYGLGIVDGLHGEELRKRTRLPSKEFRDCRRWLAGVYYGVRECST